MYVKATGFQQIIHSRHKHKHSALTSQQLNDYKSAVVYAGYYISCLSSLNTSHKIKYRKINEKITEHKTVKAALLLLLINQQLHEYQ